MITFLRHKLGNSVAEPLVNNTVIRVSKHGLEASLNFVFPLCAWIKTLQTGVNTILDSTVITGFKVQIIEVSKAPPIAPI